MIVANLATYPARASKLKDVVTSLIPQVDRLNIVFNEYSEIPSSYSSINKISGLIPDRDTKDTGKFLPKVQDASYVFFVDDDISYPNDYVQKTLRLVGNLNTDKILAGYHCSIYERPKLIIRAEAIKRSLNFYLRPRLVGSFRKVLSFQDEVVVPTLVDQVGTGAAVMKGKHVPSFEQMKSSQKFVDVRLARLCFEQGFQLVCLPHVANWIATEEIEESIARTFTQKHPRHVASEIWKFAFKNSHAGEAF